MLALVTQRPQLPLTLREAVRRVAQSGGHSLNVKPFHALPQAIAEAADAAFLVLDLNAVVAQPDVEDFVTQWVARNGSGQLVLIHVSNPSLETGHLLHQISRFSEHGLIGYAKATDPDLWVDIILKHPFAQIMEVLRRRLDDALEKALGTNIPNYAEIATFFMSSPRTWRLSSFATDAASTTKAQQNRLPHKFRKAGQGCPSDVIAAFRLFIYLHLSDLHARNKKEWRPGDIARQLHNGDAVGLRAYFKTRTGLTLNELQLLTPDEALRICVRLLTPTRTPALFRDCVLEAYDHAKRQGRPLQQLARTVKFAVLTPFLFAVGAHARRQDNRPVTIAVVTSMLSHAG